MDAAMALMCNTTRQLLDKHAGFESATEARNVLMCHDVFCVCHSVEREHPCCNGTGPQ
jgi:hypothetical protein